jgi:hypothetical protein
MVDKRERLRKAVATPKRTLTEAERQDFSRGLLGPESTFRKALFVVDAADLEWLDSTVAVLKRKRRKTNKSEIIRLGLALMKEKSTEELGKLLRSFE